MPSYSGAQSGIYVYQAPAVLNQAAPVNGTYYQIMAPTADVRVYQIHVNVEDANETLQVRITLDGEVLVSDQLAATHSTSYGVDMHSDAITRTDGLEFDPVPTHFGKYRSYLVEGALVEVEVRKVTALGAGNLTGIVTYGVKM